MREHRADHNALERRLNQHDMETVGHVRDITDVQKGIASMGKVIEALGPEIDSLHDFKTQVVTLGTLMKVLVGTSVLGAVATVITLFLALRPVPS
jgi:hypothetical protein